MELLGDDWYEHGDWGLDVEEGESAASGEERR